MKQATATALALTLLCNACATGEPWTFAASRESYGSETIDAFVRDDPDPAIACALVAVLLVPFAFDLVALPISLPHDLYVHGLPR